MVPEMVGTIFVMILKPFSLLKSSCMASLRGLFVLINAWVEILSATIFFHANAFWRFVVWTVSLLTLPARALCALQREKELKAQLIELQNRLDTLSWDREELEEHMKTAIREYEMMEATLGELEEEHEQAIHKIKLLETQLQDLKDENHQLKEVHGKSQWEHGYAQKPKDDAIVTQAWKSNRTKGGVTLTDVFMHKDPSVNKSKNPDFAKNNGMPLMDIARGVYSEHILGHKRDVALSQSLFSASLSLVVGMIVWEAEDACMQLVAALFVVVGTWYVVEECGSVLLHGGQQACV